MYDEKTVIAQPNLELKLDELYKELGKAYYEGKVDLKEVIACLQNG